MVKRVTTLLSTSNSEVTSNEVRIDTGSSDTDKVAMVRLINNIPTVNKNMQVFNGTYYASLQVNPWNSSIAINGAFNGMQFKPLLKNDTVSVYDNRLVRTIKYKHDSDEKYGTEDDYVKVQKFVEDGNVA